MTRPAGDNIKLKSMFNIKGKTTKATLFVIASMSALLVFVVFYILLLAGTVPAPDGNNGLEQVIYDGSKLEYDPYILRDPELEDVLAAPIISNADPKMGDRSAKVTIVEFSDFECAFCAEQEQSLKELVKNYKYKVRLVWKDYPESDPGTDSFRAAVAGKCAFLQDEEKFWPYHDFLYEFGKFDRDTFLRISDTIGLDRGRFESCLDSETAVNLVYDNILEANALDITGVPFLYINGTRVQGSMTYGELERMVKTELAK